MKTLAKISVALIFLGGLSASIAFADSNSSDSTSQLRACQQSVQSLKKQQSTAQASYDSGVNSDNTPMTDATKASLKSKIASYDRRITDAEGRCNDMQDNIDAGLNADGSTPQKKSTADTNDPNCANSNLYAGTGLQGENCHAAESTVQNVVARAEAVNGTTTLLASGVSQVAQLRNNGSAVDSASANKEVLMGAAVAQMVKAANDGTSATELSGASSSAQATADAMKNALAQCTGDSGDCSGISQAGGGSGDSASLKKAQMEAQTQADRAGSMEKSAAIQTAADTLVGVQAYLMAKKAGEVANGLQSYGAYSLLPPSTNDSITPNVGSSVTNPTDYGSGVAAGAALPDLGNGTTTGALVGGTPMTAPDGFQSAKSGITTASAGGGGGSGASSAPNKPNPAKGLGKTGVGDYAFGGAAPRGGGFTAKDAAGQDTALTDAIKKMLGGEKAATAKDGRSLASTGTGEAASEEGSSATEQDLSIFQQVTAKYRKLSGAGQI